MVDRYIGGGGGVKWDGSLSFYFFFREGEEWGIEVLLSFWEGVGKGTEAFTSYGRRCEEGLTFARDLDALGFP